MEPFGAFIAGFASGWIVRSTVTSARSVAVGAIAAVYAATDRARRWVATEREYFEDLIAEGRAKFEAEQARSAPRPRVSTRPTSVPREHAA